MVVAVLYTFLVHSSPEPLADPRHIINYSYPLSLTTAGNLLMVVKGPQKFKCKLFAQRILWVCSSYPTLHGGPKDTCSIPILRRATETELIFSLLNLDLVSSLIPIVNWALTLSSFCALSHSEKEFSHQKVIKSNPTFY